MPNRPVADEHPPYYARYIALVPDGDFVGVLHRAHAELVSRLRAVRADREGFRYAADKWSVREVVQHLSDVERVMSYRMLTFARGDASPLPPFDENAWVPASGADARPLSQLVDEFVAVRGATVALIRSVQPAAWANRGTMSGAPATAQALAFIIAGHERHHAAIFAERYGV